MSLQLVCKTWAESAREVMNEKFITLETKILLPKDLLRIKTTAKNLNLEPLYANFYEAVERKWGDEDDEESEISISPLGAFVVQFGGDINKFCEYVAKQYKMFLVIKAVELLAEQSDDDKYFSKLVPWKVRCQPSKLIDLFWHAHMLSPLKYSEDCQSLVNRVIDHEAGYVVHADYCSCFSICFLFYNIIGRSK